MSMKYSIDKVDNESIKGWAFDNDFPNNKVSIKLVLRDKFSTQIIADKFRQDLYEHGFGEGYCAFEYNFSSPIYDNDLKEIEVRIGEKVANLQPSLDKFFKGKLKKQREDLTVFVHIPKTAGSTIRSILAHNYQGSAYEFFGDRETYERFRSRQPLHTNRYDLIHGHVPYGIHQGISKNVKCFTFLRDPIKRFFSEYFFGFYPEGGLYQKITEEGMTLSDYIENPPSYLEDLYLKYVAGYHPTAPCDLKKNELFKAAKMRLEKGDFILCGITEYFNESILILAKELKWLPPIYVKKNVSKFEPLSYVPENQLTKLKERLYLDYELYELATDLLKAKIVQQPPSFWQALQEMEALISNLNANYDSDKNRIYTLKHGVEERVVEAQASCKYINVYLDT